MQYALPERSLPLAPAQEAVLLGLEAEIAAASASDRLDDVIAAEDRAEDLFLGHVPELMAEQDLSGAADHLEYAADMREALVKAIERHLADRPAEESEALEDKAAESRFYVSLWRANALSMRGLFAVLSGDMNRSGELHGDAAELYSRAATLAPAGAQSLPECLARYQRALVSARAGMSALARADFNGAQVHLMLASKELGATLEGVRRMVAAGDELPIALEVFASDQLEVDAACDFAIYSRLVREEPAKALIYIERAADTLRRSAELVDQLPDGPPGIGALKECSVLMFRAETEVTRAQVLQDEQLWEKADAALDAARDLFIETAERVLELGAAGVSLNQSMLGRVTNLEVLARQLRREREQQEGILRLQEENRALRDALDKLPAAGAANLTFQISQQQQVQQQTMVLFQQNQIREIAADIRDLISTLPGVSDDDRERLTAKADELLAEKEASPGFLQKAKQLAGDVAEIAGDIGSVAAGLAPLARVLANLAGLPI